MTLKNFMLWQWHVNENVRSIREDIYHDFPTRAVTGEAYLT